MSDSLLARRRKRGRAIRLQVHGPEHVERTEAATDDFLKMFYDTTEEFCWGTVWDRPALPFKQRSALSLAMTAAQSQTGAVKQHVRTALRAGWSRQEIGEILLHVYVYAGVYASLSSFMAAKEVFEEIDTPGRKSAKRSKRT